MIKFQGAAQPANLFCASQKLAGFKFEIPKSVKQDFAPYRFAGEIYTAKFSAAQSLIYPAPKAQSKFRRY
nr:hypothetical protein [uncultured Campylobacter sp.]